MDNATKKFIEAQTEKLAAMVAQGFAGTARKQEVSDLRDGVNNLRTEMTVRLDDVNRSMDRMDKRFDSVEERLDRIERSFSYRIENLERDAAALKA